MPKFAKPETQAKNVIKELTKSKIIRSLGTARSYKQALQNVAKWVKVNKLNGLNSVKPEQARFYLERRAEEVGQKTVDMERQAIQAMMQVNGKLQRNESLYCVKSELSEIKSSRAYTAQQASAISDCQSNNHRLATQIAYAAGLRAHELLTLSRHDERRPDDREALCSKWQGRSGELYTVQGKGGLVRNVLIPTHLAERLENQRLQQPVTIVDRQINYLQRYDIGAGKKWSDSFSRASKRALFFSTGGHGLRHSYAQERMAELNRLGFARTVALQTVSQEMGHFRPHITEVYLR